MAGFLYDSGLDSGLNQVKTDGTRVDICSQQPTTYAEATVTYTLGLKTGLTMTGPADRTPNGRKVTMPAITDGEVTATGTATHWAITDNTDTLVAAYTLAASQGVTDGNVFTLTAFDIGIPDPA